MDFPSVLLALKGVYGAWVNTDGFTVGEQMETYAGIRIFELAKQIGTVRHFVWSNLDYSFKVIVVALITIFGNSLAVLVIIVERRL